MNLVMAREIIGQDEIFHKSVHTTVDSHIKRLCANVFSLDNLSLCSFVEYVSNETCSNTTKHQVTRDVAKFGIGDQNNERVELYPKEGVTWLTKPTRGSAKFNVSREMT